jgi:hypothetical protein
MLVLSDLSNSRFYAELLEQGEFFRVLMRETLRATQVASEGLSGVSLSAEARGRIKSTLSRELT